MIAAIGPLVLDLTIAPVGQLRLDDDQDASIAMQGGGQAANFCAWAAALGERSRLITRVGADRLGDRLIDELEQEGVEVRAARGREPTGAIAVLLGPAGERTFARQVGGSLGLEAAEVASEWLAGVELLHVPAYALFAEPMAAAARRAVDLVRSQSGGRAILSVDLSSPAGIRDYGGARLAYELAVLAPELLFATESEANELGAPLEGLAKVPVMKLGERGCRIFNRRVPAVAVREVDGNGAGDAFAAAFCSAYLDGATPLEAAGRAVLVGAQAVTTAGARPPARGLEPPPRVRQSG